MKSLSKWQELNKQRVQDLSVDVLCKPVMQPNSSPSSPTSPTRIDTPIIPIRPGPFWRHTKFSAAKDAQQRRERSLSPDYTRANHVPASVRRLSEPHAGQRRSLSPTTIQVAGRRDSVDSMPDSRMWRRRDSEAVLLINKRRNSSPAPRRQAASPSPAPSSVSSPVASRSTSPTGVRSGHGVEGGLSYAPRHGRRSKMESTPPSDVSAHAKPRFMTLAHAYKNFAGFNGQMNAVQFVRFCEKSTLVDDRFSLMDVDLVFVKVKKRGHSTILLSDIYNAIAWIARIRRVETNWVVRRVLWGGEPPENVTSFDDYEGLCVA